MAWLLATNFMWSDLLLNATCMDGRTFGEIDGRLLELLCPDTCPGYNSKTGRPAQVTQVTDKEKVLKSPKYPNQYPSNYQNTITMDVQQPPMTIEFTNFNTEDGYVMTKYLSMMNMENIT